MVEFHSGEIRAGVGMILNGLPGLNIQSHHCGLCQTRRKYNWSAL